MADAAPDGFETRALSREEDDLPASLLKLVDAMEDVAGGFGVVPRSLKSTLQDEGNTDRPVPRFLEHKFVRPGGKIITTSRFLPTYLPNNIKGQVVDFCICVMPRPISSNEPPLEGTQPLARIVEERTRKLRYNLAGDTINLTNFAPLAKRPISVCIETKRPKTAISDGKMQMGAWQYAHWKQLRYMVHGWNCSDEETAEEQAISEVEEEEARRKQAEDEVERRLSMFPFLPSILVNGEQWTNAASTRDGDRTVLWHENEFGKTARPLGVWQGVLDREGASTMVPERAQEIDGKISEGAHRDWYSLITSATI
ncbi:hypothetical protein ED733_001765 [Metarhizium rileyi]|uniref:PD-(D/E)XK nuclease-like domain-containing protein n=1 Tax=Metarhizium rileyi (strain RCEF 4871) TaxID=1649241 RepID=A0A5C6GC76_METRR|nr:hypothetical protein ED733_001765 [Metarhizium rileyi]